MALCVLFVAFRMCVVNALVIPSPSCWMVAIECVGAVEEYPKKLHVFVIFHRLSAVFNIPTRHGCVVALRTSFEDYYSYR